MSDRMPEDLPVTKRIDVLVGITRSKVIIVYNSIVTYCNSLFYCEYLGLLLLLWLI